MDAEVLEKLGRDVLDVIGRDTLDALTIDEVLLNGFHDGACEMGQRHYKHPIQDLEHPEFVVLSLTPERDVAPGRILLPYTKGNADIGPLEFWAEAVNRHMHAGNPLRVVTPIAHLHLGYITRGTVIDAGVLIEWTRTEGGEAYEPMASFISRARGWP